MRKTTRIALIALAILLILSTAVWANPNKHRTYYFVGVVNAHPYWLDAKLGFAFAEKVFNCSIPWVGPQTWDIPLQVQAMEQTIPKKPDGTFDFDLLAKKMLEIKHIPTAAGETKVIINANANIIYENVVAVLDACRGKLTPKPDPDHPGKMLESYEGFGDVLLSAGVN